MELSTKELKLYIATYSEEMYLSNTQKFSIKKYDQPGIVANISRPLVAM